MTKIVGLVGFIGSGKGTVADYLVEHDGYVKINFADALKDAVAVIFGWPRHLLEGDTKESREFREQPDEYWSRKLDKIVTPRWVLQVVGTECFRDVISPHIWVSAVEKKIIDNQYEKVVISDCRFPNELEMIKSLGGKTYHIQRGELPEWYETAKSDNLTGTEKMKAIYLNVHPSEYKWIGHEITATIYNNDSLESLYVNINNIITKDY